MNANTKNQTEEQFSEVNWQQLYVISENWESDLLYYEDEIKFFQDLMGRYFLLLLEDMKHTRALADGLEKLEKERVKLYKQVKEHMAHLADHFSSPFVLADPAYVDEHEALEKRVAHFVKEFRVSKRLLFKHIDELLKSEKHKHLISKL